MLHLLIDTCVWLDFAKDYREQPVLNALEDLITVGQIKLVVPQVVLDEFVRNKSRVIEDARRSLQSHFRIVRDAVNRFGDDEYRNSTLKALNEVDHKIVSGNELAVDSVGKIEKLLTSQPPKATTDAVKRRVTERALAGHAPYHRSKNSVADAILIEIYAEMVNGRAGKKARFAFVTHNSKDFSEPNGDRRKPHPDIAALFTPPRSTYWGSLVDVIKDVDSELLADHDGEFNFSQQPRRLSEILEAEHLLFRQVWYNRHWNLRAEIEAGKHQVVAESEYSRNPYLPHQTLDVTACNHPRMGSQSSAVGLTLVATGGMCQAHDICDWAQLQLRRARNHNRWAHTCCN